MCRRGEKRARRRDPTYSSTSNGLGPEARGDREPRSSLLSKILRQCQFGKERWEEGDMVTYPSSNEILGPARGKIVRRTSRFSRSLAGVRALLGQEQEATEVVTHSSSTYAGLAEREWTWPRTSPSLGDVRTHGKKSRSRARRILTLRQCRGWDSPSASRWCRAPRDPRGRCRELGLVLERGLKARQVR